MKLTCWNGIDDRIIEWKNRMCKIKYPLYSIIFFFNYYNIVKKKMPKYHLLYLQPFDRLH